MAERVVAALAWGKAKTAIITAAVADLDSNGVITVDESVTFAAVKPE